MFVGRPPGNTDRILDFSTALTGGLFFAPSADFLDDLPDPPGPTAAAVSGNGSAAAGSTAAGSTAASTAAGSAGDGSLGIGSLKGSR
jgi:porphyrinogen peroxidase